MTSTLPAFAEHDFRKASASHPRRECVCVARRHGWVEIRDDKTVFGSPDDQRLVFTAAQFDAFQAGVRSGETSDLCLAMSRLCDGMYRFRSAISQPESEAAELKLTEAEVAAFLDGVARGEFDQDTAPDMSIAV